MDKGHIRVEGREQNNIAFFFVPGIAHHLEFVARDPAFAPDFFRKTHLLNDVGLKPRGSGNERESHCTGHKTQDHLEIRIVFNLHLAGANSLPEPKARRRKTCYTPVSQLDAAHAARTDHKFHALAVRVHCKVDVLLSLTDYLAAQGHGIPVGGEPAESNLIAVLD